MRDIEFLSLPFDIKLPQLLPVQKELWRPINPSTYARAVPVETLDDRLLALLKQRQVTVGNTYVNAFAPNYDVTIHTDIKDYSAQPEKAVYRLNMVYSSHTSKIRTWIPKVSGHRKGIYKSDSWYRPSECEMKDEYICTPGTHVMLFNPTVPHSIHTGNDWRLVFITDIFLEDQSSSQLRLNKAAARSIFGDLFITDV
jgi:hypothetical protein